MNSIIFIFNYIDIVAPLVTLFFFLRRFKELPKELFFIFLFVFLQFICNLTASMLEFLKITNYSIYATNILFSFLILSFLFYRISNRLIKKMIPWVGLIFFLCGLYSLSHGDGISSYDSFLSTLGSIIITAYCLSFFYWRLVKETTKTGLTESSLFWIIIGIFTYFTGSFLIFISYKYLIVQDPSVVGILWRFHNLLLTIFCIYTIYGLTWKDFRKI